MTFTCPKCGRSYDSPLPAIAVAHVCPKAEAGKPKVVAMRVAS